MKTSAVKIADRPLLTVKEASAYFGIGENKIRQLSDGEDCDFVLWVGTKRMIKRIAFCKYIDRSYSI